MPPEMACREGSGRVTVVVGIQEPCLIIPTTTHPRSSLPPLQEKILESENVKQFVQGHVANRGARDLRPEEDPLQ